MQNAVMSDELAHDLGVSEHHYTGRKELTDVTLRRDCHHCGYDIENGEVVALSVWLPKEDMTSFKIKCLPQYQLLHPLCVINKMTHLLASPFKKEVIV